VFGCCLASQFHSFTSLDLDGNKVDLDQFEGRVLLVVNVASECGYTDSHYAELQALQSTLAQSGKFSVIGYPSNQFGGQEPGSNQDIKEFITSTYGITFPVMSKVDVIGERVDPVWRFLVKAAGVKPEWNFYKYLVDGNGDVLEVWGPNISVKQIEGFVAAAVHEAQDPQTQVVRPDAAEGVHDEL